MSLWDALRMNMMISYQELVRTFLSLDMMLYNDDEPLTFDLEWKKGGWHSSMPGILDRFNF